MSLGKIAYAWRWVGKEYDGAQAEPWSMHGNDAQNSFLFDYSGIIGADM
jgi:hypothetical protein